MSKETTERKTIETETGHGTRIGQAKISVGGKSRIFDIEYDPKTGQAVRGEEGEGGARLGKRFLCEQLLEYKVTTTTGEKDAFEYVGGAVVTSKGKIIMLGCGTHILTTKQAPTSINENPCCCRKPMTRERPKGLPSSD